MAYSYVQYSGDGSTKNFGFGFPYIARENIKVLLNGVPTTAFTFISANTIELTAVPLKGLLIEIRRETARAERLVDFTDGSVLTERDLDLANAQAFYLTQEAWDRSDIVIDRANLSIDASALAKKYAELAYKYERLANDHKDNALDADDRAKAYKEIAGTFAEATRTAAATIEADRAEVSANTDIVLTAKTDVLIAKGVVESQAKLASVILTDAQQAASTAQVVAVSALATANAASATANSLTATIDQVASQQAAALAARDGAVTAQNNAQTHTASAAGSASTASGSAAAANTSASNANSSATAAYNAKIGAEAALSSAITAKAGAETAKTGAETAQAAAQASATNAAAAVASIDVSGKADVTYVNTSVANSAATTATALGNRLRIDTAAQGLTAPQQVNGKTNLGLNNVDNISDANKPVSIAQAAADALKFDKAGGTLSGNVNSGDNKILQAMMQDIGYVYLDKGTGAAASTQTFDYTAGQVQRLQVGGALTVAFSNWPPTGNLGEMLIQLVNGAAFVVTWPSINWVTATGAYTTTFSANGATLQASGTDWVLVWAINGVLFGKVMR